MWWMCESGLRRGVDTPKPRYAAYADRTGGAARSLSGALPRRRRLDAAGRMCDRDVYGADQDDECHHEDRDPVVVEQVATGTRDPRRQQDTHQHRGETGAVRSAWLSA